MNKHTVEVIIPVYKAHETLHRAVASLAAQTMSKELHVLLIVDGEPVGSYDYIKKDFAKYLDITIFYQEVNGGPGKARQVGLDNLKAPYFIFVDADDTMAGTHAVAWLYKTITDEKVAKDITVVVGEILEEIDVNNFSKKQDDFTWLTGKMYRTSFIKEHNITFPETYVGEDAGFMRKMQYLQAPNFTVVALDTPVYYWHNQNNSTMRQQGEARKHLKFVKSPKGVHAATIEVVRFLYDKLSLNDHVYGYIMSSLVHMFVLYDASTQEMPEASETLLEYAKDIYRLHALIPYDFRSKQGQEVFNVNYPNALLRDMQAPSKPTILFEEFKEKLIALNGGESYEDANTDIKKF